VRSLDVSPDGRDLAVMTAVEDQVSLWDVASGQERCVLGSPMPGNRIDLNVVKFSTDGSRLFTTCHENQGVRVWDLAGPKPVERLLPHGAIVHDLSLSGDGRWLVTVTSAQSVRIWDALTYTPDDLHPEGGVVSVVNGHVECNSREHLLAYSSSSIRRTDLCNLDIRRRIDGYPAWQSPSSKGLAFRPDGHRLAIARGNQIFIATIVPLEPVPDLVSEPRAEIRALAVRGDGARLAWTASGDPRVVVWDPLKRKPVRSLAGSRHVGAGPDLRDSGAGGPAGILRRQG
jgi:WD40 repeat protein